MRGFSAAFEDLLRRESRTILAADLTLRQFAAPSEAQMKEIEPWLGRGVRLTRITETVVDVERRTWLTSVLVSVKAVDPRVYPFYGQVKLDPDRPLPEALTAQSIAISDDLMVRLNSPRAPPSGSARRTSRSAEWSAWSRTA